MKKTFARRALKIFFIGFVLLNVIVFFHAYQFTHFEENGTAKTPTPWKLSTSEKIKTLLLGVTNPKPVNAILPTQAYTIVKLHSNKLIECRHIKQAISKGTVVLFHGYGGNKSKMIDKSDEFLKLGYNTFLVDFMGSGGSEGNQTTIGFKEAEEVKTAFDYIKQKGEKNVILYGTSMGAVAIMKAIDDYDVKPEKIIIECPFGTMYQTTCARFDAMHVPRFPMAGMLVFWGGLQNGFWAFGHKPVENAKAINCPTLLLYGKQDKRVSRGEIDQIYANLNGLKTLKVYDLAGHENYLIKHKTEWVGDVRGFLEN